MALRELARARQVIREAYAKLPEIPKAKEAKPDAAQAQVRGRRPLAACPPKKSDVIRLVGGADAGELRAIPVSRLRQAPEVKVDGITPLLKEGRRAAAHGRHARPQREGPPGHPRGHRGARRRRRQVPARTGEVAGGQGPLRPLDRRPDRGRLAEEDDKRKRPHKAADVIVPALVKGLEDDDLDGRIAVTRALGAYGPEAKDAVPALAKHLGKGDAEYRVVVLRALAGIGEDSRSALPEIVAGFKAIDPRVRGESARLVGLLSKYSEKYVDDLEKLASDPDPKVRELAGAAILRIQPE